MLWKKLLMLLVLLSTGGYAQNLVSGEYFFNTDPGVGKGTAFIFPEGATVNQIINVPTASLAPGFHHLYIRVKNMTGVWSHYEGRAFYIIPPAFQNTTQPELVSGEYFIDTDPGVGKGISFAIAQGNTVNTVLNLNTAGLSSGFHHLYVRVKNTAGVWSHYEGRAFYIITPAFQNQTQPALVSGEYFIDTDPGIGKATAFSVKKGNTVSETIFPEAGSLSAGTHYLFVRVKNENGVWSHYEGRKFSICADLLAKPSVSGDTSYCQGETISLTGSVVSNATSYRWSGPNGYTASGLTLTRNNAVLNMSGEYKLSAIRTGGTACDTSYTLVNLAVKPTYSSTNPQTICAGGSYTIGSNTYTKAGTYIDVLKAASGCDSTVTTVLTLSTSPSCNTTALEDREVSGKQLSIYPNPATTEVFVTNADVLKSVTLKDLNGKAIYETNVNSQQVIIDISTLSSGVYLVEVLTPATKRVERIVKQ